MFVFCKTKDAEKEMFDKINEVSGERELVVLRGE
jgi:hypothetical protein